MANWLRKDVQPSTYDVGCGAVPQAMSSRRRIPHDVTLSLDLQTTPPLNQKEHTFRITSLEIYMTPELGDIDRLVSTWHSFGALIRQEHSPRPLKLSAIADIEDIEFLLKFIDVQGSTAMQSQSNRGHQRYLSLTPDRISFHLAVQVSIIQRSPWVLLLSSGAHVANQR